MTLAERMTRLETKMEAVEKTITEVRDYLRTQMSHLVEKNIAFEERVRTLEQNTIQLKGKKGWLVAGGITVLIALLCLNILDEGDILRLKGILK